MAFATKKDAIGWAEHHLSPTKYGNYYDPINRLETRPVKVRDGIWKFEGRDDEWLDEIESKHNPTIQWLIRCHGLLGNI